MSTKDPNNANRSINAGSALTCCIHRRDFFLGSNFHTMPNEELTLSGFHLDNSSSVGGSGWRHGLPNALAAYRTPHENAK